MFSSIFINRPRFAFVCSIILVLSGLVCLNKLPVEEYPEIAPPQIHVFCSYGGASAQVVNDVIAIPIEDQVKGVDDVIYYSSSCENDGTFSLNILFKSGTDPDIAMVNVQNAIKRAEVLLPSEVTRQGVQIWRMSSDILALYSFLTDGSEMSVMELSNYVNKNVTDAIALVEGVSSASVFGGDTYSMRLWLDPIRMDGLGISVADIQQAVNSQNIQATPGTIGTEGANRFVQYKIDARGRLITPEEFGNIAIRSTPDGSVLHVRDIAHVELGANSYSTRAEYNGMQSIAVGVYRDTDANALATVRRINNRLEQMSKNFPKGVSYVVAYDPSASVAVSMREIAITLVITLFLVILITFLFLQDWRATLVPTIAIPISLLGTFPFMVASGLTINTLTLFGLVLVIGSLVDDAIVVVENTMAIMHREHLSARDAAHKCMKQITGAIIATTLVTVACYVPLAFYGGMVGTIYTQFSLTMCISLCLSTFIALTLSPALCSLILRPPRTSPHPFFAPFNFVLNTSRTFYSLCVRFLVRRSVIAVILIALFAFGTFFFGKQIPASFLPSEDKGVILVDMSLPPGASIDRTVASMRDFSTRIRQIPGVNSVFCIAGFAMLSGNGENTSMAFVKLDHWDNRSDASTTIDAIKTAVQAIGDSEPDARIMCFVPPALNGLGATGGLSFYLSTDGSLSSSELASAATQVANQITAMPTSLYASTTFTANTPMLYLEIDRDKAASLGITPAAIYSTMQSQLASFYINDFNFKGQSFFVKMQSRLAARQDQEAVLGLRIPSSNGSLVPLSSFASLRYSTGPRAIQRFNKNPAAYITAQALPGVPSKVLMDAIENLDLPKGTSIDWVDLSYQEKQNEGQIIGLMALAILFAYLFLVAQYESWSIPIPVMLTIATALFGAILGLKWSHESLSIYAQLGLVMLIGLTAKNAILMVEFSKQERENGLTISRAALNGANMRYRAVLMTAWSFLFGVIPLVIATGCGANARRAIGITTFSGMLLATIFGIVLTPGLYAAIEHAREWIKMHLFGLSRERAANIIRKSAPLFLALLSSLFCASGCSSVHNARNAQSPNHFLPGERILSFAESGLNPSAPIAINALENTALKASPSLLQAYQSVALAQIDLRNIKASYIPTIDVNAGYTYQKTKVSANANATTTDGLGGSSTLNMLVYDFGRTRASTRQAILALAAAECSARTAENATRFAVRSASFSLLRNLELLNVATESSAIYAEHLRQMSARHEVGTVNAYAVTKANVDWSQSVLQAVTASNAVHNARANLNRALSLTNAPSLTPAVPIAVHVSSPSIPASSLSPILTYEGLTVNDLMSIAQTNAPTLASLRANADGASAFVDFTIANLYPSLGISINYSASSDGGLIWSLSGAGQLSQSLFCAGKKRRAIDAAVAQLRIARSKVAAEELALHADLTSAVLASVRSRQQLDVAIKNEELAQENFNIVNSHYEVGKASELELSDARVSLSSAKASVISAKYDFFDSQILLSRLIGR